MKGTAFHPLIFFVVAMAKKKKKQEEDSIDLGEEFDESEIDWISMAEDSIKPEYEANAS